MGPRHRPAGWFGRALTIRAVACLCLLAVPTTFPLASAAFTGSTADDANSVSTATVEPPSAFAATQTCAAGPGIALQGDTEATGVTTLTLTPPVEAVAGDLLIAQVVNRDGYTLNGPAGWTLIGSRTTVPGSSATVSSAVFWKWAASGEGPATFALATTDNVQMVGGIVAFTGVHAADPVHRSASKYGTGTVETAPSVETEFADTVLVYAFAKRQEIPTAPAGTTQHWSLLSGSGANTAGAGAWSVPFAGPGPTGELSRTGTTSFEWVTHTLALRPALGAPSADLSWTASPSSWATGYSLERVVSGVVEATATVTPISSTSTTSGPLVNGTAYTFRLWAYHGTWRSAVVTTTLTPSC